MIKRLILSVVVVGSFLFYAFQLKDNKLLRDLAVFKTPPPLPSEAPVSTGTTSPHATPVPTPRGKYVDGEYTGIAADAFYGFVEVKVIIDGGRVIDVEFLEYPDDRQTSLEINDQAIPFLRQEALVAQSAEVDGVTGATQTSKAFRESLNSALNQAI